MKITAYCGFRRGGSGCRSVATAEEAEKILKGGYGVSTVRLENEAGELVGLRWRLNEGGRERWAWSYERDAFPE